MIWWHKTFMCGGVCLVMSDEKIFWFIIFMYCGAVSSTLEYLYKECDNEVVSILRNTYRKCMEVAASFINEAFYDMVAQNLYMVNSGCASDMSELFIHMNRMRIFILSIVFGCTILTYTG